MEKSRTRFPRCGNGHRIRTPRLLDLPPASVSIHPEAVSEGIMAFCRIPSSGGPWLYGGTPGGFAEAFLRHVVGASLGRVVGRTPAAQLLRKPSRPRPAAGVFMFRQKPVRSHTTVPACTPGMHPHRIPGGPHAVTTCAALEAGLGGWDAGGLDAECFAGTEARKAGILRWSHRARLRGIKLQ